MAKNDDYWILDNRPHTLRKLEIFRDYFNIWLTIWNSQWNKRTWVNQDWYYLDLFAGRGEYNYQDKKVDGTPLIFLSRVKEQILKGNLNQIKIKMLLIEKDPYNYKLLKRNLAKFFDDNPKTANIVEYSLFQDDCNKIVDDVLSGINYDVNSPLLTIIDPFGIKTAPSETIKKIVGLRNKQDIFFNYILEGVRRTAGIAKKAADDDYIPKPQEISTIHTLHSFLGREIDIIKENNDLCLLEIFVEEVLKSGRDNKIIGFDMPYPDRKDIVYYLLFACRNDNITKIVQDIYGRHKKKHVEASGQLSLFNSDFYGEDLPNL